MPGQDLLTLRDLRIAFAQHGEIAEVVKGVSFRVPAGRTVALVGESGSGKTVVCNAIMQLLPRNGMITGGEILFRDPDAPNGSPPLDIARQKPNGAAMLALRGGSIGMIFQEPMSSLSPVHTIGDQISEALQLHRPRPRRAARDLVEAMLGHVGFHHPRRAFDNYPFELSGGLRQRAMLAMALICHPSLLIADEPTTALDVTVQAQVLRLMKDLQAEIGMAILLITHDLGVVANMADEVVVMYRGEIMEMGTADMIFREPRHPYLKTLIRASPTFAMAPGERLVSLRDIRRPALQASAPRQTTGAPLLRVSGLRKTYGGRKGAGAVAVDDVGFEIARGECLGLVGESGSGKTTLGHLVLRTRQADAGEVIFDDGSGPVDLLGLAPDDLRRVRARMQMIFQDPVSSLSPRMTVLDILREPMIIQGRGGATQQKQRAIELMEAVGLDPRYLNRYPHSFSGGQRQRIGIARAIALDPALIVCDEPVSALDVSVQAQVLNLLKDLQSALGLAYLFISHNLAVVHYMATRIAVMARGRIVESGPRDAIFRNPLHPYTRKLLQAVPVPDLDATLDLANVALGASASDPAGWPDVFRGPDLRRVDMGEGHIVLARRECAASDLLVA